MRSYFLIAASGVSSPALLEAAVKKPVKAVLRNNPKFVSHGMAAWYSKKDPYIFRHTANGEVFDDSKMTCAVWDYPFGTRLKVTNLKNQKSVICRVNDRGPHKRLKRRIDLTRAAFGKIAKPDIGVIRVSVAAVPGAQPVKKAAVKKAEVKKTASVKKQIAKPAKPKIAKTKTYVSSKPAIRSKKIAGIPGEGLAMRYAGKTAGMEGVS